MSEVRAADLPEGSIVANRHTVFIRIMGGPGAVWRGTDGRKHYSEHIQRLLDDSRAEVLRHGYGEGA